MKLVTWHLCFTWVQQLVRLMTALVKVSSSFFWDLWLSEENSDFVQEFVNLTVPTSIHLLGDWRVVEEMSNLVVECLDWSAQLVCLFAVLVRASSCFLTSLGPGESWDPEGFYSSRDLVSILSLDRFGCG